jgi:hypothetical protein
MFNSNIQIPDSVIALQLICPDISIKTAITNRAAYCIKHRLSPQIKA